MNRLSLLFLFSLTLISCQAKPRAGQFKDDIEPSPDMKTEIITLGGGCYWCVEAVFQQLRGVLSTKSGFMGGHIPNPTYEQICTKTTGHIEVIQVTFKPDQITRDELLTWFWKSHDPTDAGGQGADRGPQYRTAIFYHSPEQKAAAEASMKKAQPDFKAPIVTLLRPAATFYPAPEEHQDYYFRMKTQNPYCRYVITPKLEKLNLQK